VLGTIEDAIDAMRDEGVRVGALGIKAFRPFPLREVRDVLGRARRVVVLEKALAVGVGGIVAQDIQVALAVTGAHVHTVIAGLGGRSITAASLREMLGRAASGDLEPLTFLDLDHELVDRELERTRQSRRSGPHAENMLRDVGVIAAGPI
jgi:pyruvate ferredoxin oxidoreductase alpha subunit